MAFIGMILIGILLTIFIAGLLALLAGLIFLIVYFVRRKKKHKKGFLITAIILLSIGIPMASFLPVLSIAFAPTPAPKTITIDNTVYRSGLWRLKS